MSENATTEEVVWPSLAKVQKIEEVLKEDEATKARIGKETVALKKRGETATEKVSLLAAKVTKQLIEEGKNPFASKKSDVLLAAAAILDGAAPATAPSVPSPTSEKSATPAKINQNIGVVSLLLSAIQIAERDAEAGNESRLGDLKKVKDAYVRVANIVTSSRAS